MADVSLESLLVLKESMNNYGIKNATGWRDVDPFSSNSTNMVRFIPHTQYITPICKYEPFFLRMMSCRFNLLSVCSFFMLWNNICKTTWFVRSHIRAATEASLSVSHEDEECHEIQRNKKKEKQKTVNLLQSAITGQYIF